MSTLQDQLLKAGLVDAKKAKQANKDKRKQDKVNRKSKQPVIDETKANAQKAQAEKAERDRQLNAERDAIAQKKAIEAQIKQLISLNAKAKGEGDIAYSFTDGSKIKKIYVGALVQDQLTRGQLAIAKAGENYELVPAVIAEKIVARDASFIVCQNERSQETLDEEDPYADYQIPDDLMW
ncbi:hypothetical protein TDB9533_04266 [Thalassocella blandensis]|nr:hypothetical protein TDB9533_04266 [Thalassocella blandensis]